MDTTMCWGGVRPGLTRALQQAMPPALTIKVFLIVTLLVSSSGWKYGKKSPAGNTQVSRSRDYIYGPKVHRKTDKNTNSILDSAYYADRVLTVSTVMIEPYVMLRTSNHSSGHGIYEGFVVDIMNKVAEIVGFRYRLVPAWDGRFGYVGENGQWDGMIGELIRRDADIAAAPMFITEQRRRAVDFTRSFLVVQATVLYRKPPDGVPLDFTSVEDLVNKPYIRYGTLNRGVIRRGFRHTNVSLYKTMWEYMKAYEDDLLTRTNEEGIQRVREQTYAFILPHTIGDYVARRKPCDLVLIDRFLLKSGYGIAVPKHSALLPYINKALDILDANGFLNRMYHKWWVERGSCHGIQTGRVFSLNHSASSKHSILYSVTSALCCHLVMVLVVNSWR